MLSLTMYTTTTLDIEVEVMENINKEAIPAINREENLEETIHKLDIEAAAVIVMNTTITVMEEDVAAAVEAMEDVVVHCLTHDLMSIIQAAITSILLGGTSSMQLERILLRRV